MLPANTQETPKRYTFTLQNNKRRYGIFFKKEGMVGLMRARGWNVGGDQESFMRTITDRTGKEITLLAVITEIEQPFPFGDLFAEDFDPLA